MAYTDHSEGRRTQRSRTTLLLGAGLLLTLAATFGLRGRLPADALAPAMATLLFALAAMVAAWGLFGGATERRTLWLDVAGILICLGVAVSALIEPEQMVRLLAAADRHD